MRDVARRNAGPAVPSWKKRFPLVNGLQLLRRRDDEQGFTLIELMVVVLIIAILIAIAIPTFLGAQNRARDRGAQSNLRNALTAAKTVATDNSGQFDQVDVAALTAAEGSLSFTASAPPTWAK